MKHLFTASLLSAVALTASAQHSFENYTCSPEPGEVPEIISITIDFPGFDEIDVNSRDGIFILHNMQDIEGSVEHAYGSTSITYRPSEPLTQPGEYILLICEEALTGYYLETPDAEEYTPVDNQEMTFTFNIPGGGEDPGNLNFDYTCTPEEGNVSELKDICITFINGGDIDVNSKSGIKVSHNGNAISDVTIKEGPDDNRLYITLPETMTAPGTYTVAIEEGALCLYNVSYDNELNNPEPIAITYTIEGSPDDPDFSFTVSPEAASIHSSLQSVSFNFPAFQHIDAHAEATEITVGDRMLESSEFNYLLTDGGGTFVLEFTPALTADKLTEVKITLKEGAVGGQQNDKDVSNTSPIVVGYTLAPAVTETLTLELSSPTKPDDKGEISNEKDLTSIFFTIEAKGMKAADAQEANVTLKGDENDYEETAILKDAYGLNQNNSYFSATFRTQPTLLGGYTITIEPQAFGDEAWMINHEFGQTNGEIVLHFILASEDDAVEGIINDGTEEAKAIYNLHGVRVNGNDLPAGIYIRGGKKIIIK